MQDPPVLPAGTNIRNELRWVGDAWAAISQEGRAFFVLTRENTVASLKAAFDGVADHRRGTGTGDNAHVAEIDEVAQLATGGGLDAVWPVAGTAPWIWVVEPEFPDLLGRRRIRMTTANLGPDTVSVATDLTESATKLIVDGVSYRIASVQYANPRPARLMTVQVFLADPPEVARSVEVDAPPAPINYHLLVSTDETFSADEVVLTSPGEPEMRLPTDSIPDDEMRYVAYARPATLGSYTSVFYGVGPNPTRNVIAGFVEAGNLTINDVECLVIRARGAYRDTANGRYIRAE